jgi:uncharacterized protein YbbC (DUF1343 family)
MLLLVIGLNACRAALIAILFVSGAGHCGSVFGADATPQAQAVRLGNEVLVDLDFAPLRGKRVGLITNPSGVDRRRQSTLDVLRRARGVKLVALFAAEHGLASDYPAGHEFPNAVDRRTSLPVYSLYGPGPVRKPTPAMLKNIDALVYDIQDTGCRSYTYISTMGLAMEACGENDKEFIVLDRPNPIGGLRIEGPTLDPAFKSFVGQWQIPYLYGMTCGELARMINREGWIRKPCKLTIVPMKGWKRSMVWRDTGLTWVPTSPNIPHRDSPLYYPCTGLLGALGGVNIGIQIGRPFECVTAPWLDAEKLSRALNRAGSPGIQFRPFTTTLSGTTQRGVEISFTDPARARLFAVNFHVLDAIRATAGVNLYESAVNSGKSFSLLDRVMGTDLTRAALARHTSATALAKSWQAGEDAFRKRRAPYLVYPD